MFRRRKPTDGSIASRYAAHDQRLQFATLEAWREFAEGNPWVFDIKLAAAIAANARDHGLSSKFHGATKDVRVEGANWRETIVAHQLNSRARAVLEEFSDCGTDTRILMLEGVTPFALALRGRFPFALGVEYLPTADDRAKFFPVQHCDITDAEFADASFDCVVSNDVLEHVPDLSAAMRETRRLLRPGGVCLATFPFAAGQLESVVRARVVDGRVEHLIEPPEYHGNPVDPKGSLVFTIPGWDILDTCRDVGFASAEMIFVSSFPRAITATDCGGVFVLRAVA